MHTWPGDARVVCDPLSQHAALHGATSASILLHTKHASFAIGVCCGILASHLDLPSLSIGNALLYSVQSCAIPGMHGSSTALLTCEHACVRGDLLSSVTCTASCCAGGIHDTAPCCSLLLARLSSSSLPGLQELEELETISCMLADDCCLPELPTMPACW